MSKRIPLLAKPGNRDSSTGKDGRLLNGFVEVKGEDEDGKLDAHVFKRPCLLANSTVSASTVGRGVYNWQGNIYSIFGSVIWKNGVSHGTGLDTTAGSYTFSQSLGGTPRLFFDNGVKAYTTDGTTVAEVTDINFPSGRVKGSAYLDGTTYIMTSVAGVYGSDINDPTAWDALNVLIAQVEPDGGVFLAKQLVYVIAFKEWSTEVFYDKANASGSPLGVVQGAKANYGCRAAGTVQDMDGVLYWVSATRKGQMGVMKLEGLKAESIATPPVERLLEAATYTDCYSWSCHVAGHKLVGWTFPTTNLTLVYDIGEKWWYQWTDTSGNYWPIVSMTFDSSQRVVAQHISNGKLYYLDAATYRDDSALISWQLYTPNFDGEMQVGKYVNRLTVIGDVVLGSTLDCQVSDDDYGTWSAARTFDLSQSRPFLQDWATFYRRAHYFTHRANTALRLEAVEMTIEACVL